MFRSVEIDRFRGFRELKVDPLERFNLILGRNNVGKTALLEAIFLLLGPTNPELPLRLNSFRGIELLKYDPEDLWGWLFYEKELEHPIRLRATTDTGKLRKLDITLKEPKEVRLGNGKRRNLDRSIASSATTDTTPAELTLNYRSETGSQVHTRVFLKETGIGFQRAKPTVTPTSIYMMARGGLLLGKPCTV